MYYRPEDIELQIGDHTFKTHDSTEDEPDLIFFDEVSELKSVDYKRITDYLDRHPEMNIYSTSPIKIDVRKLFKSINIDLAKVEKDRQALEFLRVFEKRARPFHIKKPNYTTCQCGKKRSTIAKHCQHCGRIR